MKFILEGLFLLFTLVPEKTQGKLYLIEAEGNHKKLGRIKTVGYKEKNSQGGVEKDYGAEFEEVPSAFAVVNLGMKSDKKKEEEKQTTLASYNSVQTSATPTTTTTTSTTSTTTTTSTAPLTWQNETEKIYKEEKTKKEKLTKDGEKENKKEFAFKCEHGVGVKCGEDGKCIISCGDGKKFNLTCPNNGSINSISEYHGLTQIVCGKKVGGSGNSDINISGNNISGFGNSNIGRSGNSDINISGNNISGFGNSNIGGSGKTPNQVPTFKPCFPFCNENRVGHNQPSKPLNNKPMFKPCFPFCKT